MGISQFPAPSNGGLSNDFILSRNNTNNTTFQLPRGFEAGGYALVTSDNDSTFDIYLLNSAGSSVGYTNGSSIVASEPFDTVVAYGLGTATTVQFQYRGPSTNASSTGLEPGAGAFLTSVFPADLPKIDDTTTVAGGNFSTAVQITFESGTASFPAKNVVVGSSTALVVTRPDGLINDLQPYSLRAVNPGVRQPTSTSANILAGTITAGVDPGFVTSSLIIGAFPGSAFSTSILVSDSDGTVVNWQITAGTLPPGLSFATATGAISGTPTTAGDYFFTVRITDNGQNTNSREFNLPVGFKIVGGSATVSGGTTYNTFRASDNAIFVNAQNKAVQYLVIAGGGGNGGQQDTRGGGGAGGVVFGTATISATSTAVITVGAGGVGAITNSTATSGSNSVFTGFATATGGGTSAANGGSGGGCNNTSCTPGTGIVGQGNNGGSGNMNSAGGGGGAGAVGGGASSNVGGNGGIGTSAYTAWASAIGIVYNGGLFAGGGGGGGLNTIGNGGDGGGGNGGRGNFGILAAASGSANSGGGGGGGHGQSPAPNHGAGGSGLVVLRYT